MCLSSTGILICGRVGIPDLAQDATQRTLTSFRCSFQTKKKSSESKQVTPQVLANPVNIRRSSAPPVQTRQRSLSSIKVPLPFLSSKFTFSFSFDPRTTRTATTTWPRFLSGRAGGSLSRRRTPFSSWNSSLRTRCGSRTTIELLLTEPAKQLLVKNVNSPYNGLRGLRVLRTLGVCGPLGINHSKKGLAKASWLLWQISAGGWKNSQWGECWCCEWWEFHDLHQLAPQRISF